MGINNFGDMVETMEEKIKILVISYAFVPWLAPRSIQLQHIMNQLCKFNYDITVIQRSYSDLPVPFDYKLLDNLSDKIKTIQIDENNNYKFIKKIFNKFSSIPDNMNFWAFCTFRKLKNNLNEFRQIITFSTPVSDHIVGLIAKFKFKIPWIAFFSDPFIENQYLKFTYFQRFINQILERLIITKADVLIFVNEATKNIIMKKYPKEFEKKARVIPHAFDKKLYPRTVIKNKILTIRHMGDFYGERTPLTFFQALEIVLKQEPALGKKVKVELYGNINTAIDAWIKQYNLQKIVTHNGQVDFYTSLSLMKSADVLLVIDAPAKENLFLTSKLIDYLGSKRPILALTPNNGPTAELIREMGSMIYNFYDIQGIADQIIRYIQLKKSEKLAVKIPEKIYNRYCVDEVVQKYISVLSELS